MTDNQDAMDGLLGKIYKILTAPPPKSLVEAEPLAAVRASSRRFIAYFSPGIAIGPRDLAFGNLATENEIKANASFSRLVNTVVDPSSPAMFRSTSVPPIYQKVLTQVKLKSGDLTPEEKTRLELAQSYLFSTVKVKDPFDEVESEKVVPSAQSRAYDTFASEYDSALEEYNDALINATSKTATPEQKRRWTMNGATYEKAVLRAWSRWGSEGFRDNVEKARGIIATLSARGPEATWDRLRGQFDMAGRKDFFGNTYYPAFVFPEDILSNARRGSWQSFEFRHQETHEYKDVSKLDWGGGASASYGLFSASGSASYTGEQTRMRADVKNLGLKVDLVQVPLARPWLEATLLQSRVWSWVDPEEEPLSDGGMPPQGQLPILPTALLLARNLEITVETSSRENQDALKRLEASASAGWGPFTLRGNYTSEETSTKHDFTLDGSTIRCPGAQVIGMICEALPKSPASDS